ncbi:MAG: AAA family ATPase [Patescibacteria group bacterium]|nr:MAG: AAA family ATPase [Patescibacteria group bacterium]
MRIAFVGKGGSGKTTFSYLFAKFLSSKSLPVLVIDADINQQLGKLLRLEEQVSQPLFERAEELKNFFRGENLFIKSSDLMIKTTPPGRGSQLISFKKDFGFLNNFTVKSGSLYFADTGDFEDDDIGVKCYHSKTGLVEIILNHFIDNQDEYIIVDMTAGADAFASGLFTKFDLTVFIAESTEQSLAVYRQYEKYAHLYNVPLAVVVNKVEDSEDRLFAEKNIDNILAFFPRSIMVKKMERGEAIKINELEKDNQEVLEVIKDKLDERVKDWELFYKQSIYFHQKNCLSWANDSLGKDLTEQIDPEFDLTQEVSRMTAGY